MRLPAADLSERLKTLRGGAGPAGRPTQTPSDRTLSPGPATRLPGRELDDGQAGVKLIEEFVPAERVHGLNVLGELGAHWDGGRGMGSLVRDDSIVDVALEGLCFVDTETTGLGLSGGIKAFMVGLLIPLRGGQFLMEQYLLTDPSREGAMLEAVARRIASSDLLVSFNGKSFDLPLLETRRVMNRLGPLAERPHLDLMYPARRFYAYGLPDGRLQSLETSVLGFTRAGDIAGADAPQAWFDFLRLGRTPQLKRVLHHNALDLLSLVTLLTRLIADANGQGNAAGTDTLALAEYWAEVGRDEDARRMLDLLSPASGLHSQVETTSGGRSLARNARLARLTKRLSGREAAAEHWQCLLANSSAGPEAWEELAKTLEHDAGDYEAAAGIVQQALSRFGRRGRVRERLKHRLERLLRKAGRPELERRGRGLSPAPPTE